MAIAIGVSDGVRFASEVKTALDHSGFADTWGSFSIDLGPVDISI